MMAELPESSNDNSGSDLEAMDYLRGVKSSTCLLLSSAQSPTPMDFKHPLSDEMNEGPFLTLNDDGDVLQNMENSGGDSSSSADSNSLVQDPVSAQLINNISMLEYQTLSKNGDLIMGQTDDGKFNGAATASKLPSFVTWNWVVIRKVLLWVVLSGLIACLGAIVGMVVTIPRTCNPDLPWHQGKVFYEVFAASFKDTNGDGIGDLKGLTKKLDYIEDLGVSAIRLNYIFESSDYPEKYNNITSMFKIHSNLGTEDDLKSLVKAAHNRNISVILDLPVISVPTLLPKNATVYIHGDEYIGVDMTSAAIAYWARTNDVDGFYLKELEDFVDHSTFARTLRLWKEVIGPGKILIASEETYKQASGDALTALLARIDLIDIHLDTSMNVSALKKRITDVINGPLWAKPHYPWVHWNIGNVASQRVASKHENNSLALTVLEYILPGTISIYYGDEIGLGGISIRDIERDYHEHNAVHNLVPMSFANKEDLDRSAVLSWNTKSSIEPKYHYVDIVKNLINVRLNTPTIYMKSIYKEGVMFKSTDVRSSERDLVVIERWYPRRNSYVFVGNLGSETIKKDLSTMFYGGTVVAGTNASLIGEVLYFNEVTFLPHSGVILKLEK